MNKKDYIDAIEKSLTIANERSLDNRKKLYQDFINFNGDNIFDFYKTKEYKEYFEAQAKIFDDFSNSKINAGISTGIYGSYDRAEAIKKFTEYYN